MDFGPRKRWKTELLTASRHAARQVQDDAAAFNRAYDEGAFNA
jgi:hypothetical protein